MQIQSAQSFVVREECEKAAWQNGFRRVNGQSRNELRYILDPADVKGPNYPSETFRVLKEKAIRQHAEYRPPRLVLAAWDRMETGGDFAAMGM